MMATAYGTAVMDERRRPRQNAELAAYVRWEYGRDMTPEAFLAEIANGAGSPPRRRRASGSGLFAGIAKTMKSLLAGSTRKAEGPEPAR